MAGCLEPDLACCAAIRDSEEIESSRAARAKVGEGPAIFAGDIGPGAARAILRGDEAASELFDGLGCRKRRGAPTGMSDRRRGGGGNADQGDNPKLFHPS